MRINVLDKGYVELKDHMGGDIDVVNAARVSFHTESKEFGDKEHKLLLYLAQHKHMSPFRHVVLKFRLKAPEFVMRQWYKHIVGINYNERCVDHAWNEISGRYIKYEPEFYVPHAFRKQSANNKQATTDEVLEGKLHDTAMNVYQMNLLRAYEAYEDLIRLGVGKEQARAVLPISFYTEVIWTTSLEAVANFIKLRDHEGAQWEIREYAKAVRELTKQVAPVALEALGV